MTDAPIFTILLPVVRPPVLLRYALESVQRQEREDFELFVVCDGAPAETVNFACDAATRDPRIRVFPFAKGERNGELHRHAVLAEARGRYVLQIGDDDLWFPNHLTELNRLLQEVDFGHTLHTFIDPKGSPCMFAMDLADPWVRQRLMEERWNYFGPTVTGYKIETYRRLPVGWSPAPKEIWSDLFMWRKFLSLEGISVGSRFVVTALQFRSDVRQSWGIDQRREEMARYAESIQRPEFRTELTEQALHYSAWMLRQVWGDLDLLGAEFKRLSKGVATSRKWRAK